MRPKIEPANVAAGRAQINPVFHLGLKFPSRRFSRAFVARISLSARMVPADNTARATTES